MNLGKLRNGLLALDLDRGWDGVDFGKDPRLQTSACTKAMRSSHEHTLWLEWEFGHGWVKVHVPLLRTTSRLAMKHDGTAKGVAVLERTVLAQLLPYFLNKSVCATQSRLSPSLVRVENRSCSFAHMAVHAL